MQITITPTADLITSQQSVAAALFAVLNASYTPTYGPSASTQLPQGTWIYLWANAAGTQLDYAAIASLSGYVPPFATYTTAAGGTFALPDADASGRIYFGVPDAPAILINSGQPVADIVQATTYDFVEFTYTPSEETLTVDVSAINQFGIPIQLQTAPPCPTLPNGSGVFLDRADVLSQYQSFASPPFQAGLQDMFGQPVAAPLGILSPATVLSNNCVMGVTTTIPGNPSQLAAGTYYYAVTALDANNNSSWAQPTVASISVDGTQTVTVQWGTNASQTSSAISQYNVYRGTPAGETVTWTLIASPTALSFGNDGGQANDTGQAGSAAAPALCPLATYLDSAIESFFNYYAGGNTLSLAVPNSAYQASGSWIYSFAGTTQTDPVTGLLYLSFALTGAVDEAGDPIAKQNLPFPVKTRCNIYYPYWSTNTFNQGNPAAPSWAPFPDSPASMMVFAANGVFADNLNQVYYNLPAGVTPPPPPPAPTNLPVPAYGTPAYIWQSLLSTLENMVVSALTRGIAAPLDGALPIAPLSWASQPQQTSPTASAAASSLDPGTTYYYVVTALTCDSESAPGLEFTAVPTSESPSVQINWLPVATSQASSFNVYRGEQSQGENVLVGNVTNSGGATSFVDSGGGTSQTPPVYYPAGAVSNDYCAFLHQTSIAIQGGEYGFPYDDQGSMSSTLTSNEPTSLTITVGPWSS